MTKREAYEIIKNDISTTNNGKLLKFRVTPSAQPFINELIKDGFLKPATFMNPFDAIKLG